MDNEKIKNAWDKLNPNEERKQSIMNKIQENMQENQNPRKRRISGRTVLIAAIIAALTITTALAYGGVIQEFIFGDSRAVRVEVVEEPNTQGTASYWIDGEEIEVVETEPMRIAVYNQNGVELIGRVSDTTPFYVGLPMDGWDEWDDQYAPFTIRKPSYLPMDSALSLVQLAQDEYGDAVAVTLNFTFGGGSSWVLGQFYVGQEGYFELETTYPIEKVMIGDIEALLMEMPIAVSGVDQTWRVLTWMSDGYVFMLDHAADTTQGLDLETLIAIAESIG